MKYNFYLLSVSSYTGTQNTHVAYSLPNMMLYSIWQVKATDDSLFSGFLHASNDKRNWQRRYFAIHDDFVLYSFYDNEVRVCLAAGNE